MACSFRLTNRIHVGRGAVRPEVEDCVCHPSLQGDLPMPMHLPFSRNERRPLLGQLVARPRNLARIFASQGGLTWGECVQSSANRPGCMTLLLPTICLHGRSHVLFTSTPVFNHFSQPFRQTNNCQKYWALAVLYAKSDRGLVSTGQMSSTSITPTLTCGSVYKQSTHLQMF